MPMNLRDIDETEAPLLDHLIELRTRLVRAIVALLIGFGICLYFADDILGFLIHPLKIAFPVGEGQLIFTKLYEVFFVELKVALFAGFFISFPIIANQLWAFIAPGLYAKEKRAFALPAAGDYLGIVMQFILAFGITFLLPVLLLLLSRAGIVTREQLIAARRYVIVGVVALAAIVTPPDPGSQLILAVPLLLLFEGSLILMRFQKPLVVDEAEDAESEAPHEGDFATDD